MGKKTPIHVLETRGSLKRNPGIYKARTTPPPFSDGPGDPPPTLSLQAQACWFDILAMAPPGLLCRSDRLAIEVAACLMSEFRLDPVAFPAARATLLQRLLGKFAMLPADRATMRLPAPPRKDGDDPFAEFTDPMEKLLDDTPN